MRRILSVVAMTTLAAGLLATATAASAPLGGYEKNWAFLIDGWNRSSSPVVADIDGDGVNEIVFGHQDGKLRAYEGDGSIKWSVAAVPGIGAGCNAQASGTAIDSSPAVADLDDDGSPEVIVGVGSTWVPNQNGSVVVFDGATGAREWGFTGGRDRGDVWANSPTPDGWCEGVFSTPAIGDVDGDGELDIVFASWDFQIWAVDASGTPLSGFPVDNDDSVWSSAALYDVDDDDDMEIFIGGDSTLGGTFNHQGGVLRALDWTPSGVDQLWHRTANEVFHSSPAIGDINGDGRAEVVIGTGENWHSVCGGCASDHTRLFAFHADDGSTAAGWPVSTSGTMITSPAIGDVDDDGMLEVVMGSADHTVRAWNGDGSTVWNVVPGFNHLGEGRITGSPVIADLDGDGDQDVAVGTELGLALLDGRTGGSLEWNLTWPEKMSFAWSHESSPAIGVLEGERRIVFTSFSTPGVETRVASYSLPPSSADDHWPMFRHSATRDGRQPIVPEVLCGPASEDRPFCDVPAGAYYEEAVAWMVSEDITTGVSPGIFGPNLNLSRAQMVTFLWRQDGEPTGYPDHGFADVPDAAFYDDAVAWAKAEGITTGTGPTTFSPMADVTRGQIVTLMWRRAGEPGGQPPHGFVDVPAGTYYSVAVAWAKAEDITTGTTPVTFSPNDPVSRAQAAAFVHREAGSPPA